MTRKILAGLLALAMVFALALTACGSNNSADTTAAETTAAEGGDSSTEATTEAPTEAVDIDWYIRQDMSSTPDFSEYVWPAVQEYFQKNLNVNVTYHGFDSSTYGTKFQAAITSGTGIDLMFLGQDVTGFYVWYERNALEPLDDLISQYASDLNKDMPDYAWNATTIDGKIYAIPTIKDLCTDIGLFYNETMLENTGLTDDFNNTKFENAQDLNDIFYKILAARNEKNPEMSDAALVRLYQTKWAYFKADELTPGVATAIPGIGSFSEKQSNEVFNIYSTQEYKDMITLIQTWVKDGIYPYDAKNYDPDHVYNLNGYHFGDFEWGNICAETGKYADYGWVQQLRHPTNAFTNTTCMQYCMHAINALTTDEKKVASMKVYNALSTDPELSTMMRFGVEGIHWQKTTDASGNTRANFDFEGSRNADAENGYNYFFWYFAEFGDLYNTYLPTTMQDDFFTTLDTMNKNAVASDNMGFMLVTTDIANQIAAVANVVDEYDNDLTSGMTDDVDSQLDAFNQKLSDNGMNDIVSAAQTQLNAWKG